MAGQGIFLCPVFCFIKCAALGLTESHKKQDIELEALYCIIAQFL